MLRGIRNSLRELFFPSACCVCGAYTADKDQPVCPECIKALPVTEHATHHDNKTAGLFTYIKKVKQAASYCYYDHEKPIYDIIHSLKYHNKPQLGAWIGEKAARHFISKAPDWFNHIDYIIPIPLHSKRLEQRRYNQAELIADGISRATGIKVDTKHLIRKTDNTSQTLLTIEQRRHNAEGIFELRNGNELSGRHILLVDDVITTGSTMLSAIKCLTPVRGLQISVFAIGCANYGYKTTNQPKHSRYV